jgi:hypothetical protein
MHCFNEGRLRRQFDFLKSRFLQDGDLPFTEVLTTKVISKALVEIEVVWNDRIYTPLVTLWVFLGQVLSADHSCRAAVARLLAHQACTGQRLYSPETSAYCQARKRLPEKFFSSVARDVERALHNTTDRKWLWKGRSVYMFDGTTVTMPDTPENQAAYPQMYDQKPGLGFPIARVCTMISLSCGAILDMAICGYAGKGTGELSMLHQLWNILSPGDILLTDSLMSTWREMLMLKSRGIDSVSRFNKGQRRADFRRGKRLSKGDHIVRWPKPTLRNMDWQTWKALPQYLEIREIRVHVAVPGFRSKEIVVVTTILDPQEASKEDLAKLYRSRWNQELDLRDIKVSLQMDVLRCKTPELVRKEIWTHVLAYNLIRTVMAQAASRYTVEPRTISFKATVQTLKAFHPILSLVGQHSITNRNLLYEQILKAIAIHRVGDRPNRFEPRKRKGKPRYADQLVRPRAELKRLMCKGVTKI